MTRIYCSVLIIALIVATASGDEEIPVSSSSSCSEATLVGQRCYLTTSFFPLLTNLASNKVNITLVKDILKDEGSLYSLCGEMELLLGCIAIALSNVPDTCLAENKNITLTLDHVGLVYNRTLTLCSEDNSAKLSSHAECLLSSDVEDRVKACATTYPNSDCASDELIKCTKPKVTSACGAEAANFVVATENAVYCGLIRTTLKFLSIEV